MNHLCWTILNYNRHRRAVPRGDAEVEDESTWHERRGSTRAINTAVILFEWPIWEKNTYVITLSIRRGSRCHFPQISYFQTAVNVFGSARVVTGQVTTVQRVFFPERCDSLRRRSDSRRRNITFIISTVFSKNISRWKGWSVTGGSRCWCRDEQMIFKTVK